MDYNVKIRRKILKVFPWRECLQTYFFMEKYGRGEKVKGMK